MMLARHVSDVKRYHIATANAVRRPVQGRERAPAPEARGTAVRDSAATELHIPWNAEISPDGRWIAYQSDESGQYEIYARPFPAVDSGRWQISTTGGTRPLWAHSGKELFYLSIDGSLMRVTVEPRTTWTASAPARLLDTVPPFFASWLGRTYDISLDDQRFLMLDSLTPSDSDARPARFIVVQNWHEELNRLVPTN
jgi:hypothetical protein